MTEREDTIERIERVLKLTHKKSITVTIPRLTAELAVSILKAQEPRAMTLEELDAIYQKEITHVWPFDTPPYMFMTVNPNVRLVSGFWICWRDIMYSLENNSPFYVRENYGKEWIIWTKKPTVAQLEAVKWP